MSTTTTASPTPSTTATTTAPPKPGRADVKLTNKGGALPALADFYTWGLQDPRDVGTGSGVLAVAAAKLGAGEVVAMDYDRTAATVAQENVERNHVEDRVTTGVSDLLQSFMGKADLIIANIIADIVIRLFDELDAHLDEGGHLLASGIIDERVADVTEAALAHGFAIDKVVAESGWAAMVISREDAK